MSSNTSKTILLLAANPKGTTPLRLDEEVREIDAGLQRSRNRDQFVLEQKWAVRPRDIQRGMLDSKPSIVHFSGHGTGDEGLVFEDKTGIAKLVDGEALAGLFELFAEQVECVVLNGCYSEVQATAIARHVKYVIGMNKEIGDRAAIEFAVAFYDALGAGRPIEFAHKFGCAAIRLAGIPEQLTPVLKKKPGIGETVAKISSPSDQPSSTKEVTSVPSTAPIEVFFSYSHKDEQLRDELAKHLSILKRQGIITAWYDREISAGEEWAGKIDAHLNTARVILLLISSDFLASDYCYDIELTRAMERHAAREARVIPVILREVDWKGAPFGKLQALPKDALPVNNWSDRDQAFTDIARGIRNAVDESKKVVGPLSPDSTKTEDQQDQVPLTKLSNVPELPPHYLPRLEETSETKWVLILDGTLDDDLAKEQIETIVERLRHLSGDASLKLDEIKRGSIILKLDGSEEGFKVIQALHKEGRLTELLGLPVKYVGYEIPAFTSTNSTIDIFFSYSHRDEKLRNELANHLSILEKNGVISGWCDRQISAGEERENQIDKRMNNACIILLLVSSDFIASKYCWNIEVKRAMERHQAGEACVVPVILRPVNWRIAPFGQLEPLPKNAKPVTRWRNRDEAFLDISQGIETVVNRFVSRSR